MTSILSSNRWRGIACAMAAFALATGCQRDEAVSPLGNSPTTPALSLGLELSSATARDGDTIAVAIRDSANLGEPLQGLQGYLHFDASQLQYVGQAAGLSKLVLVNDHDAAKGELRFITVDAKGLDARAATLVFAVKGGDYTHGLGFELEGAASRNHDLHTADIASKISFASDLSVPKAEKLTAAEWVARVAPAQQVSWAKGQPVFRPGQYLANLKYGDATLDGTINVTDVAYLSNISVGLVPLIDVTNRDAVIAGNVRPINGGTGGTPRPGVVVSSGVETPGVIDVSDVSAVSNKAVGFSTAVTGDQIPGREPAPPAGNRRVISADITANQTWFRDSVYELGGQVKVRNGATLTIQPGTRIEGVAGVPDGNGVPQGAGVLVIDRDGYIIADGTALQPIVFSCTAATPTTGCWGGFYLNGNAPINNGTATSPALKNSAGGCLEQVDESGAGSYGGCDPNDSSGVIRYVRVEYPGTRFNSTKERNVFTFNGVGRKTVVDYVQAHAGLDDGMEFFGGTVNVKHVVLTGNEDDQFDWNAGWIGKAQFVVAQADSLNSDRCIEADNYGIDGAADPDALPRSNPTLYNFTCVGKANPSSTSGVANNNVTQGVLLRQNTAGTLRNFLVYKYARGLDIDSVGYTVVSGQQETTDGICDQIGSGALSFRNAFLVAPSTASSGGFGDPDGGDPRATSNCGGYTHNGTNLEAQYIADAANAITTMAGGTTADALMINPTDVISPDFRPKSGTALATAVGATPPNDGFFDPTATYIGATPAANGNGSNIPWWSGWTRGWRTASTK